LHQERYKKPRSEAYCKWTSLCTREDMVQKISQMKKKKKMALSEKKKYTKRDRRVMIRKKKRAT
jgi:hypothetical protein